MRTARARAAALALRTRGAKVAARGSAAVTHVVAVAVPGADEEMEEAEEEEEGFVGAARGARWGVPAEGAR